MKTLLAGLTLITLSLTTVACNSTPTTPKTPPTQTETPPVVNNEASCKAAGGTWQREGRAGHYGCVLKAKDAGKSCTDSDQCQYRCLAKPGERPQTGQKANGQCQTTSSPFGCRTEIKDGIAEPTLCVD